MHPNLPPLAPPEANRRGQPAAYIVIVAVFVGISLGALAGKTIYDMISTAAHTVQEASDGVPYFERNQ